MHHLEHFLFVSLAANLKSGGEHEGCQVKTAVLCQHCCLTLRITGRDSSTMQREGQEEIAKPKQPDYVILVVLL
jgi:hypothetical protein